MGPIPPILVSIMGPIPPILVSKVPRVLMSEQAQVF